MIIATPKIHPDLDGYACAYAYAELLNKQGKEAMGAALGTPHKEAVFMQRELNIEPLANTEEDIDMAGKIVLVDASDLRGMPHKIDPIKVVEVIDHRNAVETEKKFPNAEIDIQAVGAAATLIGERFREKNIEMSKESATLIYGAIASNTLNFHAQVISERDHKMFDWIEREYNLAPDLIDRMFEFKSNFENGEFMDTLEGDFKKIRFNVESIGIAQLEVVGLKSILEENREKLYSFLKKTQKDKNLGKIFLTSVDVEEGFNIMVSWHEPTQELLSRIFHIEFNEGFAILEKVILRKEIIPLLREEYVS